MRERKSGPAVRFRPAGMGRVAAARSGALLAGLAVALGAFGAHLLEGAVTPERLATFETGVRYQMYHGLGLLLAAALGSPAPGAGWLLLIGNVLFSGSLYALVLSGQSWLGAVAPLGGALQIAGWLLLALGVGRGGLDTRERPRQDRRGSR